jgi:penicillin amidase
VKILKAVLAIELAIALTWLLGVRLGNIPPIGKLLNPAGGFWNNSEPEKMLTSSTIHLNNIGQEITVQYDKDAVPHLFAANDHDLYFAQGYITARDRLWQMDMQARMAAGRVAEVMGAELLDQDRYFRRMGLTWAAERSLALMLKDPVMKNVLEAYTEGVNAYINQLSPAEYPLEFKLMDYRPAPWKPINSILIFKLMAETLSAASDDFQMSNNLKQLGTAVTRDLFPDHPFLADPVIPQNTPWNFTPQPIPETPDNLLAANNDIQPLRPRPEGIGSNNWAIAGSRSVSGYPLLANDPHLNLTLPAIWYQVQLIAPGVNVYGVSIPGIPCVVIGYNQQIAWGLTNAEADAVDWYRVQFRDATKNEYWYKGHWNTVSKRLEPIKIKGGKTIVDTIAYTHQGPIARQSGPWDSQDNEGVPIAYALSWVAHAESEEIRTFYLLNRGKSYNDYQQALQYFSSPAQNFIFASVQKDIAITSNGRYPLRYPEQGKFILDGSAPADDWHGWIRPDQNPSVKNPERGFVSSANQAATDSTYPYYLGWQFGSAERARRINDRLAHMQAATVDSLRIMQSDNYSVLAEEVLPCLLSDLKQGQTNNYAIALQALQQWNYHFDADSIGATIFNLWWNLFYKSVWSDEFDKKSVRLRWPSRDRTVKLLLTEKEAHWFDDRRTPQKETCAMLINQTFMKTVDSLFTKFGPPGPAWRWGSGRQCRIAHLAGINAFSLGPFAAGGAPSTIDALGEDFGPSWRMVVEMGPVVKGYGIFPGGQSGNPGSYYYDNLFDAWKQGQLHPLLYLQSKEERPETIMSTLILK